MRRRHPLIELLRAIPVAVLALAPAAFAAPGATLADLRQARIDAIRDARRGESGIEDVSLPGAREGIGRSALPARIALLPTNVQHNNKGGDGAGTTQSGGSIAMDGSFGIASWNDGLGGVSGFQGLSYTTDGGASWIDVGSPPIGGAVPVWSGSPVCAVNPQTHEFYVAGIGIDLQQIVMSRVTFPGGTFTISAPLVIHQRSGTDLVAEPWLAVDPQNGNLYATWTQYVGGTTSRIEFARSSTNGTMWDPVVVLNGAASNGLVEGARPQVGPNGEVHVVWHEIGLADLDRVRIRTSTTLGVSFGVERTAISFYANFGSGSPGFNRLASVDRPSIAVDVSNGPRRGRIYVAVNESVRWSADPLGTGGSRSEVESNNTTANATSFAPGQQLRGSIAIASPSPDFWSFAAIQGTTYIFVADSVATMYYTMRIFCSDGATSLAQSGDNTGCPGDPAAMVWTAPASGTYYLRVATVSATVSGCPASAAGGYRIQTGTHGLPGPGEIARDHRDIVVGWSDDGATWTKTRVNDDPGHLDDFLPEVQVAGDGCPYVLWLDWRDAAAVNCGGSSASYVSRSTDGGATWAPAQRVAGALTNWNVTLGNLTPNQGDHLGLHASGARSTIAMSWGDGRLGDVDEFGANVSSGFAITGCPGPQVVVAQAGGVTLPLSATIENRNVLFGNTYGFSLTNSRGWSGSVTAPLAVDPSASAPVLFTLQVPDTAKAGPVTACLIATLGGGADRETCCVAITVDRPVATLASVVTASAGAGHADVEWQVNVAGPVSIQSSRNGMRWDTRALVSPDGSGRVRHHDTDVTAGERLGYRLSVPTPDGARIAGEVWIEIPAAVSFALRPLRNPVMSGTPMVELSLPVDGPAALEIIDLNGRRLHRQELAALGAGLHIVTLPAIRWDAPGGVYLVRLTQGTRSLTRKITLLP